MRLNAVMSSIVAIGLAFLMSGCSQPAKPYTGPGCLLYLYPLPGLGGIPLPVRADTADVASAWHEKASSVKVVYGTWRLFTEPTFTGFVGDYKAPIDDVEFAPPVKLGSLKCTQLEPGPPPPAY